MLVILHKIFSFSILIYIEQECNILLYFDVHVFSKFINFGSMNLSDFSYNLLMIQMYLSFVSLNV
jgi:hypothetical protein